MYHSIPDRKSFNFSSLPCFSISFSCSLLASVSIYFDRGHGMSENNEEDRSGGDNDRNDNDIKEAREDEEVKIIGTEKRCVRCKEVGYYRRETSL